MESVSSFLIRTANAGLSFRLDGNAVLVSGPSSAESIVQEIFTHKPEIVAYLRAHCGALHLQPERWMKRKGKAYCPACNRYMGHCVSAEIAPKNSTKDP